MYLCFILTTSAYRQMNFSTVASQQFTYCIMPGACVYADVSLLHCYSATTAYGGSAYQLVETGMNWRQAFGHCAQLGGYLVVIDDEQGFSFTRALYLFLNEHSKLP